MTYQRLDKVLHVAQWIEANLANLEQCKAMDVALLERATSGQELAHPNAQMECLQELKKVQQEARDAALVRHLDDRTLWCQKASANCRKA